VALTVLHRSGKHRDHGGVQEVGLPPRSSVEALDHAAVLALIPAQKLDRNRPILDRIPGLPDICKPPATDLLSELVTARQQVARPERRAAPLLASQREDLEVELVNVLTC
jgi:hypothetical protein